MTVTLAGALGALALVDSTSLGTLVLPIWLMLQPGRLRAARITLFLLVVAAFYWVMGLALLAGAVTFGDSLSGFLRSDSGAYVRLALGVALLVVACLLPGKKAAVARQQARKRDAEVPRGRLDRWRERAMTDGATRASLVALAVLAVLAAAAEIPTMVPYLAAIALLGAADLAGPVQAGALAAYCSVMVAPAALLLLVRMATGTRLDGGLARVGDFLEREAAETIGWLLGIAGFLLATRAGLELYG
jgi:hypothetical protein